MSFEVFKKSSAPMPSVPSVTIQKRGLISLNRAAYALIEEPEAVELLWDAQNRLIGLRPTDLVNPDGYPARAQNAKSDRGPILIAGSLFTRFIGLDTTHAKRWVPREEGGILVIDLNVEGQPVSSNRRKSRSPSGEGGGGGSDEE